MKASTFQWAVLALLSLVLVGCQESFTGEWVEDRTADHTLDSAPGSGRREAFQFDGISTVRTGALAELGGVVDNQTIQFNQYFVFDGGRSAQIGALVATFSGGKMIVSSADGSARRVFSRVNGPSIFPPYIQLPRLTQNDLKSMELPLLAESSLHARAWETPLI